MTRAERRLLSWKKKLNIKYLIPKFFEVKCKKKEARFTRAFFEISSNEFDPQHLDHIHRFLIPLVDGGGPTNSRQHAQATSITRGGNDEIFDLALGSEKIDANATYLLVWSRSHYLSCRVDRLH
jgi:hypothetical protein